MFSCSSLAWAPAPLSCFSTGTPATRPGALSQFIEDEQVTIFGTSASYLDLLKAQGMEPARDYDLTALREILQTGSALSPEGFAHVYEKVKPGVHFNSISGGTDINGCFAIGAPTLPVYAGELEASTAGR